MAKRPREMPALVSQRSGVSMLAPHDVVPIRQENAKTVPIVLRELDKLGYSAARAHLKQRGEDAFSQMAGPDGRAVSAAKFANHASQNWGWCQLTARAAFSAVDLDQSGAIASHEYLLLLAAMVYYGTAVEDHANPTLRDVRARTLFVLYHIKHEADPADIASGWLPEPFDITLGLEARTALLRDLCAADSHVEPTLEALDWHMPDDADNERALTYAQFRQAASSKFGPLNLSMSDARVVKAVPFVDSSPRLVLDPRAMQSAREKPPREFTAEMQSALDSRPPPIPMPPVVAPAHSLVIGPRELHPHAAG